MQDRGLYRKRQYDNILVMLTELAIAPRSPSIPAAGAKSRRLFRYAMMRMTTLERAGIRSIALDSAKYSTAFSVAYTVIGTNSVSHDLASPRKYSKDVRTRARSAARIPGDRRAGTDVHPVRQSRSAPSASRRVSGAAGSAGMLRRGSEDDASTGEAHLLMPKGDVQ